MFKSVFKKFNTRDIGIDLGTSNTLVYLKDKGIIINEPSVVAVNIRTEQILAVGDEAKRMLGKTPPHIVVTKPLSHGIISDYEVAERMIRYFIDKVYEDGFSFVARPRVVVSAPLGATEVEIKAAEDAAISAGAKEVFVVQEPIAAAIGARMSIQEPVGNMIVNVGGGTTDVAIISLNGIVSWKTTKIAGDELNKNIMQYSREMFNLFVGESHAEYVKIKVGSAMELSERIEFPMRGRDVMTGLPKEIMINDEHVRDAMERSISSIVEHIKMTLEITPPELIADIHERGIMLSGGGSLLRGLDKLISRATNIAVRIVDDPLTAVVRGLGVLLEDRELLKEVAMISARDIKKRS